MNYSAHPSAIVDDGAQIGAGTRIWHWVHVSSNARIGEHCSLGQNVYIGNDVVIGKNVTIQGPADRLAVLLWVRIVQWYAAQFWENMLSWQLAR